MIRAALVLAALALARPAFADQHAVAPGAPADPGAPAALLDAQLASATRARGQVEDKQREREAARRRRIRVAYKLLRGAGSPLTVAPERRLAVARGRATARLLLGRDRAEVAQLADEARVLAAAVQRIERDRAAPALPITIALARPASGTIVRRFGTLEHDRARATLARRGIDLEVAADAPVVAPADGVVRYAGPIRGLDHGVILEHGGFVTVIAKLAPTPLVVGTRVARGERLGTAQRRRVYLEVRLRVGPGGTPVDPEPLLR